MSSSILSPSQEQTPLRVRRSKRSDIRRLQLLADLQSPSLCLSTARVFASAKKYILRSKRVRVVRVHPIDLFSKNEVNGKQ